jgi:hypothetical protein
MNRVVRTSIIATAVLATALGVAGPALAATGTGTAPKAGKSLDVVKKAVTARIDLRLAALKKDSVTLAQAKQVQSAHRATLSSLISSQTSSLTALRTKVGGETTNAAVKADAQAMVDDFRVFILTGPKVRLTAAIDTELVAAGKLGTKADPVASGLAGKVDTLLAIKPGPDGDAIRAQVKTIRTAAKTARTSLKAIRKETK